VEPDALDVDTVRAALAQVLRPRAADDAVTILGAGSDDLEVGRAYLTALADGGWMVPTWPAEFGGRGMTPADAGVVSRALAGFEAPDLYPYLVGLHVVAPTLLAIASEEQKHRWLRPIASGTEIWCQLFSEPGAGSDLANVGTRAERDGDVWRVTGQKVWTSRGHYARWGFLVARSDPNVAKHAGITTFAVDMGAPGVEVRPLRQMNGDAHFSEVFLDGVEVPDTDRIGAAGAGWNVTRTALANERGALGVSGAGTGVPLDRLLTHVRERTAAGSGGATSADAMLRDRAIREYVAVETARLTTRRARDAARTGRTPGPEGSGSKLRGSATMKSAAGAALAALGADALLAGGEWQTLFLTAPSMSIRGGTDEIQRNIVGERVLGLAPEPRVDVDRPWSEIPH
jgi:alkylation response protein AidB-like acyl-CoA dehydrogenase